MSDAPPFQICGSAAAEAIPAMFCGCRVCDEAWRRGGKDMRSRAAYQLSPAVRIDFGPDSNFHAQRLGLRYDHLEHLLITHTHEDHWAIYELAYRQPGFSHLTHDRPLIIHGNEMVERTLNQTLGKAAIAKGKLQFQLAKPFEPIRLSGHGIEAIPLPANHKPDETPFNYLLHLGDRWLLQGNDTGWYVDEVWDFLKDFTLDAVVMDSTSGRSKNTRNGHMSADVVLEVFDKLDAQGSLAPNARRVATHFSHNGDMLHEELVDFYQPHGVEPAYDGMTV